MPITFSCSSCANLFKVADSFAGRRGKCPRCGTINLVPAAGRIQAAPPPPKPTTKIVARKIKRAEPKDDEIHEIDESDVVEEVEEVEEVEDVEDVEEVEDRPQKKRGKKKSQKKKKGKSAALLFGILGAVAFLLLCTGGVGGLVWWKYFSGGSGDDLKYLPDNSQFVASIRVSELAKSEVFKELKREIPQIDQQAGANMSKEIGVGPEDIESVTIGGGGNFKDGIVILRTKKAIDDRDLVGKIKNVKYTETKVGKYVVQESQDFGAPAFCLVSKKVIVVGEKETLRAVLTRDKKPVFSQNLQAAMAKTDFSKTIAFAVDIKASTSKPVGGGLPFLGDKAGMSAGMDKAQALVFQAKIAADVRLDLVLLCQDAKSAEDVKKVVDGLLVMGRNNQMIPKELNDLLDIPIKTNGSTVTASKTIRVSPLIQAYKQKGNQR